jgi:hypothetical protein
VENVEKPRKKRLGFPTFSTMPVAALDPTLLPGNQSRSDSPNFAWKTLQRKGRSQEASIATVRTEADPLV